MFSKVNEVSEGSIRLEASEASLTGRAFTHVGERTLSERAPTPVAFGAAPVAVTGASLIFVVAHPGNPQVETAPVRQTPSIPRGERRRSSFGRRRAPG